MVRPPLGDITNVSIRVVENEPTPSVPTRTANQSCKSDLQEQSNKRARERYANMCPEKKEAYLKRRRDNYHKRKALMASSASDSNLASIESTVPPAQGLYLDHSISRPNNMNACNQSSHSPMDVSQIANTGIFQTPMIQSQKGSNQLFLTPMGVSRSAGKQLFL